MSETPNVVPYAGQPMATHCPLCQRPINKPHKCKTLYGVLVCNRCRNGFASRRQAAYLVDAFIYFGITQAIWVITLRFLSVNQAAVDVLLLIWMVAAWAVFPLVFTLKDAVKGRSPGKVLLRIRVVDAETREPSTPMQSVKRNLVLAIPYVGVIGGLITMMKGQRWGDGWAKTMVIWNKYAFREPFARSGQYCHGCGYDLTGNTSGRCPECGLEIALPMAIPAPPPLPAASPAPADAG